MCVRFFLSSALSLLSDAIGSGKIRQIANWPIALKTVTGAAVCCSGFLRLLRTCFRPLESSKLGGSKLHAVRVMPHSSQQGLRRLLLLLHPL
jgi:hypothetical protein